MGNQFPSFFSFEKEKIGKKKREKKRDVARLERKERRVHINPKKVGEVGEEIEERAGLYFD